VVYDANDKKVGEKSIRTAGKPAQLKLDVWTQHDSPLLNADGEDLAFVTVSLTDKQGTLIPDADDQLDFEVSGAGSFEAVCNGDATSLESFKKPTMKLFKGQLVVVVRSTKQAGVLTLTVKDKTRKISKTIKLNIKDNK
jgi:beta-galactosidase